MLGAFGKAVLRALAHFEREPRKRVCVIRPLPGDARRHHVAVADRLDLLDVVAVDERVEAREEPIEKVDHLARVEPARERGEVDDVREDARVVEVVGDQLGSDWRRCATSAGRTLSRSVSTRACAVSRPRANVTSNSIATKETTTMLRTSKVRTKASGGRRRPAERLRRERARARGVATKAQTTARRGPAAEATAPAARTATRGSPSSTRRDRRA